MSDRFVVAGALAAVLGAWLARPLPWALVVAVVILALSWRRPWTAVVAVVVVTSVLGARAWSGLQPVDRAPFAGMVTLVSDPENVSGAVQVEVRDGSRRLEAWVRGPGAGRVRHLLAGERVHLAGRVGPPPEHAPWLVPRHVRGRIEVDEVGASAPGHPATRLANRLRRTLYAGAVDLADPHRALFAGLVLGDDREQDPVTTDDFRGAGLTHLLAVSGQNVAFVLALTAPATGRLGWRGRWFAVLAVLAFFALVTRFEPSVLRATVMAALATTAAVWEREAAVARVLALAVAGLVVIDPLLVHSVGFQLSVGASVGIAIWAGPLADRLPGPAALRSAVGVTVAAQLGVAPILVPVFGGVPVASIPANLLAGWAAGPVMVWGLTAGLVAGLVGGRTAGLLHIPTEVLVGWIAAVARWSSGLRLGEWSGGHVAVLVAVGGCWSWCRHRSRLAVVALSVVATVVACHPAAVLRLGSSPRQVMVSPGATLYDGSVLVIDRDVVPARLLEGLRRQGADRPDLIGATSGGARAAEAVALLRARYGPVTVVAPSDHRVRGAVAPAAPWEVSVGDLRVTGQVAEGGSGLAIQVAR